jgi:hypothetical protein
MRDCSRERPSGGLLGSEEAASPKHFATPVSRVTRDLSTDCTSTTMRRTVDAEQMIEGSQSSGARMGGLSYSILQRWSFWGGGGFVLGWAWRFQSR